MSPKCVNLDVAGQEPKSTFLSIRAAEAFADLRITDPMDRERFLELVRGAMAGPIKKGAPLRSVRLRESHARSETASTPVVPTKREEPSR